MHHELQAPARPPAGQEPLQLGPDPFGGDNVQARGHLRHGVHHVHLDVEAQLGGEARGPHYAQRVVVEGLDGAHRGAQDARLQVRQTLVGVHELQVGQAQGHGVDGEVAAAQVPGQGVAVGDGWLARAHLVGLGAVGGHLHDRLAPACANGPEVLSDVPGGVAPLGEDPLRLLGSRGGGQVQVVGRHPQEGVPDRAPDQCDLVPGAREEVPQDRQGHGQVLQGGAGGRGQAPVVHRGGGSHPGLDGVAGVVMRGLSHQGKPATNRLGGAPGTPAGTGADDPHPGAHPRRRACQSGLPGTSRTR